MSSIVYIRTFCSRPFPNLVQELVHAIDGIGGIRICTDIKLHSEDRTGPSDYDTKIAFNTHPNTNHVYKLGDLPVFIDDRYTTVYLSAPYDIYVLFKRKLYDSPWNLIKHVIPVPDIVYSPHVVALPITSSYRHDMLCL